MKTKATVSLLALALMMVIGCGKKKDENKDTPPSQVALSDKHLKEVVPYVKEPIAGTTTHEFRHAMYVHRGVLAQSPTLYAAQLNVSHNRTFELNYREYENNGTFDARNDVKETGAIAIDTDGTIRLGNVATAVRLNEPQKKGLTVTFLKNLKTRGLQGQKVQFIYEKQRVLKAAPTALFNPTVATAGDLQALSLLIAGKQPAFRLTANLDQHIANTLGVAPRPSIADLGTAVTRLGQRPDDIEKLTKAHIRALTAAVTAAPNRPVVAPVPVPVGPVRPAPVVPPAVGPVRPAPVMPPAAP